MRKHSIPFIAALAAWLTIGSAATGEKIPRNEHPRPDFRRDLWTCLNGPWQFRFDPEDRGLQEAWYAGPAPFDRQITVPFCWQSKLSGVADLTGQEIGWYRRTIRIPPEFEGRRIWLRFDAVDWDARVWIDGHEVGRHEGGYTPFEFDVTPWARPGEEATVVVRAADATDRELPLGKQVPGWYTPTSGIWQTVWLEARPAQYIDRLRLTPTHNGRRWVLAVELEAAGPDGEAEVEIASPDPTVENYRGSIALSDGRGRLQANLNVAQPKLWTPDEPHLYDLDVRLKGADGTIDTIHTYFGLRTIQRGKYGDFAHEVILLNDEPIYLRGALDQSFNPSGIYTAPSDEFLRRDMEIAKRAGFNFLRIHVKSEEPRRLVWADRLGVLIMEDMPCTWEQTPRARRAWEETMRATIQRDRNHPCVIAWCLFNESWGLGNDAFKSDRDTQSWVLDMWTEVKQRLDPSRLVEDNSPCRFDHVRTDLNSWHFYIDDDRLAREHIGEVVERTRPGASFNYVPSQVAGTEPLINSEYGAVSARGGDRDVSWGFRSLTTQLRRHGLIGGYVYTEFSDVEWEHNGVVDYDRSAKEFGYDAFVPGMTIADLQGADFVGFDAPPVIETSLGEEFTLPVFVSHYSDRTEAPTLVWQINGVDTLGRPVSNEPQRLPVVWRRAEVTFQEPLRVRVPEGRPLVGALALELLDREGRRIAANFVNLIVHQAPEDTDRRTPLPPPVPPRVEVLGPRLVAVRFEPSDFASFRTDESTWDWLDNRGKFFAHGACEVEYHLALPKFVRDAIPTSMIFMAELATKADHERLDWPAVRRALDYPQTQDRKHPGKVGIRMAGDELWQVDLPDDPADARGVLSHQARYHHGSYGYLLRQRADLTEHPKLREAMRDGPFFPVTFRTLGEGRGLSIYGRRLGRFPIDPTIILQTARDLSKPVGWATDEPVAADRLLDRSRVVQGVPTAEQGGHTWRYTTEKPPADWMQPAFDDASWQTGPGGFGRTGTPAIQIGTPWTTSDVWLRTDFQLPAKPVGMLLGYFHDEDVEIYANGKLLLRAGGYTQTYQQHPLTGAELALFRQGTNTLAVHCRQTHGSQGIDVGVLWIEVGEKEKQ